MNDLGQWSEAVGGTGGVGQYRLTRIGFVVDTHHKHGGIVLGRRRDDDTLGSAARDVGFGLFLGRENTGGLTDRFGSSGTPRDI